MTLEEWQDKLAALEDAFTSGVLLVKHKDVETQFRNMDDIAKAISYAKQNIRALGGTPRKVKYIRERENEIKRPDGGY